MLIESRPVKLTTRTGVEVRRTLPHRDLKMIGAWCFVDHFGPTEQTDGMVVAKHPHTGLQTVTWLIEGAIEHRDSQGSVQRIEPGQLNLMTAGHGISHSEISLAETKRLHAVQLWVALPDHSRDTEPFFEHQDNLPKFSPSAGVRTTLLAGQFMGHLAATKTFSDLLGAEIRLAANTTFTVPLTEGYEYGFIPVEGSVIVNDEWVPTSSLQYLAVTEAAGGIELKSTEPVTLLLLAGVPFGEKILMWWNFIARTQAEISQMRDQWNSHLETEEGRIRFGNFTDSIGGWIPAPELPNAELRAR